MSLTMDKIEQKLNDLKRLNNESLSKFDGETLIGMCESLDYLETYIQECTTPELNKPIKGLVDCARIMIYDHIVKHYKKPELN